jgi:hypothetical protein
LPEQRRVDGDVIGFTIPVTLPSAVITMSPLVAKLLRIVAGAFRRATSRSISMLPPVTFMESDAADGYAVGSYHRRW